MKLFTASMARLGGRVSGFVGGLVRALSALERLLRSYLAAPLARLAAVLLKVLVAAGGALRRRPPTSWLWNLLAVIPRRLVAMAERSDDSWKRWLAFGVLAALYLRTALAQLDGLLQGMRRAGEASFGLDALTPGGDRVRAAAQAVNAWAVHAEDNADAIGPDRLVWVTIVVAAAAALAFTAVAVISLRRAALAIAQWRRGHEEPSPLLRSLRGGSRTAAAEQRAAAERGEQLSDPIAQAEARRARALEEVARIAAGLAGALLVVQLSRLVLSWWIFRELWRGERPDDDLVTLRATAFLQADPEERPGAGLVGLLLLAGRVLAIVQPVLLGAVVAGGALILITLRLYYDREGRFLSKVLHRVRGQVLVVVLLAAALLLGDQSSDVIRRWNGWHVALAVGLAVFLAFAVWEFGRRLVRMLLTGAERVDHPYPGLISLLLVVLGIIGWFVHWRGLVVPALFAVGVALLGQAFRGRRAVPGAAEEAEGLEEARPLGHDAIPRLLGCAVVVLLGLAVLRAMLGEFVYAYEALDPADRWFEGALLALSVALGGVAWLLYVAFRALFPNESGSPSGGLARFRDRLGPLLQVGALASTAAVYGLLVWNVWKAGRAIGSIGLLLAFCLLVALIAWWVAWAAEKYRPPTALRAIGFRRTPVITLFVAWVVLAANFDGGTYHDVREIEGPDTGELRAGVTLHDAWCRWLAGNDLTDSTEPPCPPVSAGGPRPVRRGVPLVMVATSGGGIRAAFWTGVALDCVFERDSDDAGCDPSAPTVPGFDLSRRLFLGSGISGGSVGLANYAAYLSVKDEGEAAATAEGTWIEDRLGDDFLSASLAWQLFVEAPRAFLRFDTGMDRAEVLEESWEQSWEDEGSESERGPLARGLKDLWAERQVPLLIMNGTTVEGCRFNSSLLRGRVRANLDEAALEGAPAAVGEEGPIGEEEAVDNRGIGGECLAREPFQQELLAPNETLGTTRDLVDYVCDQDVALSTAALLSARFPYISPSGRMVACNARTQASTQATYVVDGGYLDLSGASTVVELWPALQVFIEEYNRQAVSSCVVPFLLQLDNGYEEPTAPGRDPRPSEVLLPPKTLVAASGLQGRSENARQAAALVFHRPFRAGAQVAAVRSDDETHRLESRYQRFAPRVHPGARAPLGWSLSRIAMEDLRQQVSETNGAALATVRSWLAPGGLRCVAEQPAS